MHFAIFYYTKIWNIAILQLNGVKLGFAQPFILQLFSYMWKNLYNFAIGLYCLKSDLSQSDELCHDIKVRHIKIVETDWRMITIYCVCDHQKRQTGSIAWTDIWRWRDTALDATRKYARRRLSETSFRSYNRCSLLKSVSAADGVTDLPVGIDY